MPSWTASVPPRAGSHRSRRRPPGRCSPNGADRGSGPELSEREQEVLALVGEGLPNKLIARKLEISEKTVKAHLTRIFRELGVDDRTQAALWAREHLSRS